MDAIGERGRSLGRDVDMVYYLCTVCCGGSGV